MPDIEGKPLNVEFLSGIRDVIEYSGLSFNEVMELPCDLFLLMRKNYVMNKLNETEEGKNYIATCERLNTTKADRAGVKAVKKKLSGGDKNA